MSYYITYMMYDCRTVTQRCVYLALIVPYRFNSEIVRITRVKLLQSYKYLWFSQ